MVCFENIDFFHTELWLDFTPYWVPSHNHEFCPSGSRPLNWCSSAHVLPKSSWHFRPTVWVFLHPIIHTLILLIHEENFHKILEIPQNLHSLERAECMMVRWMCGESLKDRKQSEVLYSLLGVQSLAKVVRHGRLRWFGHVDCKRQAFPEFSGQSLQHHND